MHLARIALVKPGKKFTVVNNGGVDNSIWYLDNSIEVDKMSTRYFWELSGKK